MSCCVRIPWDMRVMSCRMRIPWDMRVMSRWVWVAWYVRIMPSGVWVRVMSRSMRITWMMARWVVGGVMSSAMRVAWVMPCRVMVATVTAVVVARIVICWRVSRPWVMISAFIYCPVVICKSASSSGSMSKVLSWYMDAVVRCVMVRPINMGIRVVGASVIACTVIGGVMSCWMRVTWMMAISVIGGVVPCWVRITWMMSTRVRGPWDMGVVSSRVRVSWRMGIMPCWVWVACNVWIMPSGVWGACARVWSC